MALILDLSSAGTLFAIMSLVMLAASELLSNQYGKVRVFIRRERLRVSAILLGLVFASLLTIRLLTTFI